MHDVKMPMVWWVVAAVAVTGCSMPAVEARHALPAAVNVTTFPVEVDVATFSTAGDAGTDVGDLAAKLTRTRMPDAFACQAGGAVLSIGGQVRITVGDSTGRRALRTYDAQADQPETVEVPSLVRKVDMEALFEVRPNAPGRTPVLISTRHSYDSLNDPNLRGPLGMDRPDRPEAVPSVEHIAARLLVLCVDDFWGMVTPGEMQVKLTLRPAPGPDAALGIAAARDGDLPAAAEHFQAAEQQYPRDKDVVFDLATLREATGRLAEARQRYQDVAELTHNRDAAALTGAQRVRLVMIQQGTRPE
jgi:hypothetical protein